MRFLAGVAEDSDLNKTGGSNTIPPGGQHSHSGTATKNIRKSGWEPNRQFDSEGPRTFNHSHPVSTNSAGRHDHGGTNQPQYYTVRSIMLVR